MKKHILFATLFALGLSNINASAGGAGDPDAVAGEAFLANIRKPGADVKALFSALTNGQRAHVCRDENRVRVPVTKRFAVAKLCDAWEAEGRAHHTDFAADFKGVKVSGKRDAVSAAQAADAARRLNTAGRITAGNVGAAKSALSSGGDGGGSSHSSRDASVHMDPRARAAFEAREKKQGASDAAFRAAMEKKQSEDAARLAREAEERLAKERADLARAEAEAKRLREKADREAKEHAAAQAKLAREKGAARSIQGAYRDSIKVKAAKAELARLKAARAEADARAAAATTIQSAQRSSVARAELARRKAAQEAAAAEESKAREALAKESASLPGEGAGGGASGDGSGRASSALKTSAGHITQDEVARLVREAAARPGETRAEAKLLFWVNQKIFFDTWAHMAILKDRKHRELEAMPSKTWHLFTIYVGNALNRAREVMSKEDLFGEIPSDRAAANAKISRALREYDAEMLQFEKNFGDSEEVQDFLPGFRRVAVNAIEAVLRAK